jgi:hypothetical protein
MYSTRLNNKAVEEVGLKKLKGTSPAAGVPKTINSVNPRIADHEKEESLYLWTEENALVCLLCR